MKKELNTVNIRRRNDRNEKSNLFNSNKSRANPKNINIKIHNSCIINKRKYNNNINKPKFKIKSF